LGGVSFPQRRKDAKKARKDVEALFILKDFFVSFLCAFAPLREIAFVIA
jgi:hypothetical protein